MTLVRKLIVSEVYEGRTLEVRYMGPDLLGYVTAPGEKVPVELSGFFLDARAAIAGGKRFVDEQIKEAKKREVASARATR